MPFYMAKVRTEIEETIGVKADTEEEAYIYAEDWPNVIEVISMKELKG